MPQPKEMKNQMLSKMASVWRFFFQYCFMGDGAEDIRLGYVGLGSLLVKKSDYNFLKEVNGHKKTGIFRRLPNRWDYRIHLVRIGFLDCP